MLTATLTIILFGAFAVIASFIEPKHVRKQDAFNVFKALAVMIVLFLIGAYMA